MTVNQQNEEEKDLSVGKGISFKKSLLAEIGEVVNLNEPGRLSQFVQAACQQRLAYLKAMSQINKDQQAKAS